MKKRTSLWVKFYPQDFLDGTVALPPRERAMFIGILMLIYIYDGPVPDDAKWIAHNLQVPVQTWLAARKLLIARGKLRVVDEHLTNARAVVEIKARAEQCATNKRIAIERESQRRKQRQSGADLETRRTEVGAVDERDAGSAGANSISPNKSNDGDARCVTRSSHHAHARENHHQIKNENKNSSLLSDDQEPSASGFSITIEDDDDQPLRRISLSIVKELGLKVGEVRAQELVSEYEGSPYALGAMVLDRAFVGWLRKTYNIHISGRGAPLSLGEMHAIGGTDAFGVPQTNPADIKAKLAARAARMVAHG